MESIRRNESMRENEKKGTLKEELMTIEILDGDVSGIIVNALLNNGYDVVKKSIGTGFNKIGEHITIYRVMER